MRISRKAKKLLAVVLTTVLAIGTFQFAPGVGTIAKAAGAPEAGNAEDFTMMLDDVATVEKKIVDDKEITTYTVEPGEYKYGDSVLTLVGNGSSKYTVTNKEVATINGKKYNSYKAGNRSKDCNNFENGIPKAGDGTATVFAPAADGIMTVYIDTTTFLRVHAFDKDGKKTGTMESEVSAASYTFKVMAGQTYVMSTTSKTNNMNYVGYKYIVDNKVSAAVNFENVDAQLSDSLEISVVDAELGGSEIKLTDGGNVELYKGHTYRLSTNDGGVRAAVGDSDTFEFTGDEIKVLLYNVSDVTVEGKITGTPEGTVTELSFVNMLNGREYKAEITGDAYTCSLKPGEYYTKIVTTNEGVTHDRVSVKTEGTTVNEVYVELPAKEAEAVAFKSEINVPGDYATLNEASTAILNMKDRPEGEEGRVTINLNTDIFEQTVMEAAYVTLKGNNHTISWYYGVGTFYYSIDPKTGYYNEALARDRYSSAEGNGSLWGGVFIVKGNNFIAEDTTFKNTYNYELTDAEKTDIDPEGSALSASRLAPGADVSGYTFKERSNAFYINADNIECYNCKILSSQDTLGRNGSANNNYHTYFNNCVIGGNVDYICGEFAAVFDNCELQWKTYKDTDAKAADNNKKVGYITAAKTSPYVFRDCKVTTDGVATSEVTGYYGRTWGDNSNCSFIRTQTNGHVLDAGWGEMGTGQGKTAVFKEYANVSGDKAFVSNGAFCTADNQKEEAVADYIESDKVSVVNTVLGGWTPVHYAYELKPDDKPINPDDGKDEPTIKPDDGKDEPTTKPDDGKDESTTKPDAGKDEPTIKPDDGKDEPTTKPDAGKDESTTKPDAGNSDKAEVVIPAESDVKTVEVSSDVKFVDENGKSVEAGAVQIVKQAASETQVAAVKTAAAKTTDVKLTDKAQIVDISLKNSAGVVKLSNGTVKVSLKKDVNVDYTKYAVVVYHLKDDNTLEKLDVKVSEDVISFVTGGFSPFVIDYVALATEEPTTKPDTGKEELTTKPATEEPTTKPSGNESETTAAPTGEQNTEAVENETPGTGDSAPVVLYLLLVFAAIMLISGTTVYEKKRMK